ncbi:dual specificity protein phosphatase 7-like [Octopus sinensis]|uniref:protein-tyrosine-phosphatase n=1 Tax=Octopus sinensis TaxID=2607531 RepID=A0A6P7S542_9MOLL|nr:dual specificity protein phosphatase 7-like [Octopus sinensis]
MPCLESAHITMDDYFTPECLRAQLRAGHELPLLDCRSQCEFARRHIIGAINITMPALLQKRLKTGNLNILGIIHNNDANHRFKRHWKTHKIVLYDDCSTDLNANPSSFLNLLLEKLRQEGCSACYLLGGFSTFEQRYPELSAFLDSETESTIIGLRNLSLSSESSYNLQDEESDTSPSDTSPLPVQVLPNLFLGNAKNSQELSLLKQNGIKYILNVTANMPNMFEKDDSFKYMQIPINDHWSQNLSIFFPKAIEFIEEGLSQDYGVLVHCLAGISRSVTVTVAYLMQKMSITLNDAYDRVKKCKPNISPNINFMGQLLDFEKSLNCDSESCLELLTLSNHETSPVLSSPDEKDSDEDRSEETDDSPDYNVKLMSL